MGKDVNIDKVVRQHIEIEQFFSGFTLKGKITTDEPQQKKDNDMTVAEKAAELEKIAEEIRECCKCGLGSTRTNAVPGEGNPDARIMFIGEGPGADEDAQGRPFVGRAGQLLDKIIIACGLKRSDVYIGNILKCRPPDNRDPRADEIISCLPFLQRQIEIINPEIIVALGAHAAKTLLNTTKSIGQNTAAFDATGGTVGVTDDVGLVEVCLFKTGSAPGVRLAAGQEELQTFGAAKEVKIL